MPSGADRVGATASGRRDEHDIRPVDEEAGTEGEQATPPVPILQLDVARRQSDDGTAEAVIRDLDHQLARRLDARQLAGVLHAPPGGQHVCAVAIVHVPSGSARLPARPGVAPCSDPRPRRSRRAHYRAPRRACIDSRGGRILHPREAIDACAMGGGAHRSPDGCGRGRGRSRLGDRSGRTRRGSRRRSGRRARRRRDGRGRGPAQRPLRVHRRRPVRRVRRRVHQPREQPAVGGHGGPARRPRAVPVPPRRGDRVAAVLPLGRLERADERTVADRGRSRRSSPSCRTATMPAPSTRQPTRSSPSSTIPAAGSGGAGGFPTGPARLHRRASRASPSSCG